MALPLLALALPLASMLAVTSTPPVSAADAPFSLPAPALQLSSHHQGVAEQQALPHARAPGYDGPWVFDGPVWSAQRGQHGPQLEVGALGGGHEWAPSLAHVAVDWHF